MTNILVISGSPRPSSYSDKVTDVVVQALKLNQVMPTVLDLHKFKLPMFEGYDVQYGDQVKEWADKVAKADGIIFIAPEYHGFIPGALKNALDFLHGLDDKVVALITVSSGQSGHLAHNALMQICRNMKAWLVPMHVVVTDVKNAFEGEALKNEKLTERIRAVCEKTVTVARKMKHD